MTFKNKEDKKAYNAAYRLANKEKIKRLQAAWRLENKEKIAEYDASYHVANTERRADNYTAWRLANPERRKESYARYRRESSDKIAATDLRRKGVLKNRVLGDDPDMLRQFYKDCPSGWQVDHIHPLQGKKVSGFHTLANLQFLPERVNISKGNRFTPGPDTLWPSCSL